jgi:hypothetical protein
MPNGSSHVRIPAKVYPGVFPGEFQSNGVDGYLRVDVVGTENDQVLVALPGEVQGATSRLEVSREQLEVVA